MNGFLHRCLTRNSVLFFIDDWVQIFNCKLLNRERGWVWSPFWQQGDCLLYLFSKKWGKKMFLRSADKMSGASCQYSTEIGVESFKSSPFSLLLFLLLMSFPPISQHLYQKYIRCNEVSHIWIIRSIGKVKSGYVGFCWETWLLSQKMLCVQLSPFLSRSCQPCPLIIHPLQSSPLHRSHQSSKVLNQPSKCPSHLLKQMVFRYFF